MSHKTQQPKRVILRLRYNEFEDNNDSYDEAIGAYLASIGREFHKYTELRHVAHIEGHQDYMMDNPRASFHITLDIDKDGVKEPVDLDKVPHEMYRRTVHRRPLTPHLMFWVGGSVNRGSRVVSPLPSRYPDLARQFTDRYAFGKIGTMDDKAGY